jgi:hypothetical protein
LAVERNQKRMDSVSRTRDRNLTNAMPNSAELRAGVYVIISAACGSADPMVKRVLAGQAFALAQQAQLRSWTEAGPQQRRWKE